MRYFAFFFLGAEVQYQDFHLIDKTSSVSHILDTVLQISIYLFVILYYYYWGPHCGTSNCTWGTI